MGSVWIDVGVSLFSGCLISFGLVQLYRFFFMRNSGQDVYFIPLLFGDLYEGRSLESVLKELFFTGVICAVLGLAGIVAMFIFF